jgi:hypothetical protein
MLHVPATFPTAAGPRMAFEPRPVVFPTDPTAALALACALDRKADLLLAEGRGADADRLAHAAYELRCRAGGGA